MWEAHAWRNTGSLPSANGNRDGVLLIAYSVLGPVELAAGPGCGLDYSVIDFPQMVPIYEPVILGPPFEDRGHQIPALLEQSPPFSSPANLAAKPCYLLQHSVLIKDKFLFLNRGEFVSAHAVGWVRWTIYFPESLEGFPLRLEPSNN